MLVQTHVAQHHDARKEQGGRVGLILAGNIRSRTVDSLEDGSVTANVARRSEAEAANKTGTHIRKDVAVKVGHHHNGIRVVAGVFDDLQK
ncbi:hypothetical protein BC937DRAFT_88537 [Endogone sp. FLAS-F59071]|nr:hypothetical protein BC937DRAFT_88537 [Endogone sp. FLAS-F59071]|eukprot:RUS18621.1 hypothetical protein BC937DRAFT_88537 [Endogone sp. FLAS-F59071]